MAHPGSEPPAVWRWIRTDCGRAKYQELAARPGWLARLRLAWFVLIAALRDLRLPHPEALPPQPPPGPGGPPG
jgi:hypothetical protein